jgi:hypothetical protein
VDDGNDEEQAPPDEVGLEAADVDPLSVKVSDFWEGTELLSVQEMLREVGLGQVCKAELIRQVLDDEAGGAFGDDVAKPGPSSLVCREWNNRTCQQGEALDGVMEGDVEVIGQLLSVGVDREGKA